ncbi:MAG: hypothetical protein H6712_20775 [Myxococcales bacterium]|nr:hypothetical protein [Myxococcales bacterium]MCB9716310.1 hypothetical protein [Myxococcales bacterium]
MSAPPSSARASRDLRWVLEIDRFLERTVVRLVLSAAIIISLLPFEWVHSLDMLLLGVFTAEFVARLFVMIKRPRDPDEEAGSIVERPSAPTRRARTRAGTLVLLLADLVALVSFLPLSAGGARWLRLFRLTRMVLLVSYWAPLVIDLWSILSRRERSRQIVLMGFVVGGLSFAGALVVFHLVDSEGVVLDVTGDETVDAQDRDFFNMLWWAFRQVQDPGNMLASPIAIPLVLISLGLTVFGLFLVSFLIGLGTDVVHELMQLSRLRPAGLRGHTVIVGVTPPTPRLLAELMRYYKKLLPTDARLLSRGWFRDLWRRGLFGPRYLVVGRTEEPPDFLRQPELSRIVYRERADRDDNLLVRADLASAKRIVLLADHEDDSPDAQTIQTLLNLVERVRSQVERGPRRPHERQRVVIAEILDDSNIAAARAAVAAGRSTFRSFVVPTERLVALFIAGVVRRPGLGDLLEELLTSRGHELYTCFFQTEGLGFTMEDPPELGRDRAAIIERLLRRGLGNQESTIVPVGLLLPPPPDDPSQDFQVVVNPRPGDPPLAPVDGQCLGLVAIADNFGSIRAFAEDLPKQPGGEEELAPLAVPRPPRFERTPQIRINRMLVCGFRRGSIYMLEELLREQPSAEVLVLVEDEATEQLARDAIDEHTQLVVRGMMPAYHGAFTPLDDGSYLFDCARTERVEASRVRIRVADWMASRHLVDLPEGFGHVGDLDAVVFVSDPAGEADARTTTTLLKLEQLLLSHGADPGRPRVVAEIFDARLAARLEEHFRTLGKHHVRIYSIPQLRAFFLFQSVVVPGFDSVYSELLGSWGQSFVRLRPAKRSAGTVAFRELALGLRQQGLLLIAVRLQDEQEQFQLCVAPGPEEPGFQIDLAQLRYVWVIADDRPRGDPVT